MRPRASLRLSGADRAGWAAALAAGPDAVIVPVRALEETAVAARRRGGRPPLLVLEILPLAGSDGSDLDLAAQVRADAVLLGGSEGVRDLEQLSARLAVREAEHGLSDGAIRIVAGADTPAAAAALPTLRSRPPGRLAAVVVDPAALAKALCCEEAAPAIELAGASAVLAAAAARVPALVALRSQVADGRLAALRRQGYAGVVVHDPAQVAAARRAFG